MAKNIPPDDKLADLEDGKAVSERLSDPDQALRICRKFYADDKLRAARRLKVQSAFNGNAPKSDEAMRAAGRGNDSNLNFKRHRGQIMNAWTPFFDLVCEVPVCIDGDLDYGDASQNEAMMRGFAEYFHQMMFNWRGFDDMSQLCDLQMLLHGPGVLAWEDAWDWRPKAILAGNIYFPNEVNISLDNCEMVVLNTPKSAGELWRCIEDEETAKKAGWNAEAVKRAIMDSASNADMRSWKWERWEQAFKNGDIYISQTQTKIIQLWTIFVQEMDGTISQKVIPFASGNTKIQFLYESVSRYEGWDQCLCLFPYDIGADGTYHSVKGLGTDIYPFCALLNNIDNSIADLVIGGIKPMWQPETNAKMEDFRMAKWGGGNFVPKGINPLQMDISRGIAPALEVSRGFAQTMSSNTAAASNDEFAAPTVEETAKSAMIRASERAKLTKGLHNRYMRGKDRQYSETWRRAINPKLSDHHPGSKEALAFQNKCKKLCRKLGVEWERAFPAEDSPTGEAGKFTVLECVTNIRANRSLGLGSAAMRIEIANQLMANIDRFDEIGQNEIKRMFVAVMTSFHSVDAIVPSIAMERDATNDEAVAAQEDNAFAILGPQAEAFVTSSQNHVLHLQVHIPSMQKDMQLCDAGEQDPRQCQRSLEGKGPHANLHLKELKGNPTRQKEYKMFSTQLSEIAAYQDHLDQTIAEQDQAAAEQPQPGEVTPEMAKVQGNLAIKQEKEQGSMALKAQKQQFDQQMKVMQAQFDKALKDAQAAADIARDNAITRNELNRANIEAVAKLTSEPATSEA